MESHVEPILSEYPFDTDYGIHLDVASMTAAPSRIAAAYSYKTRIPTQATAHHTLCQATLSMTGVRSVSRSLSHPYL
jgi:hypothetical protein